MVEHFFVGLARGGREIGAKGYRRQPLTLTGDRNLSNAARIAFAPALEAYGFIDGLALCGSIDGPVIATSPLTLPMHIAAGSAAEFAPGYVVMTKASLAAIRGMRPAATA